MHDFNCRVLMPAYDPDTSLLYLAGRVCNQICYFSNEVYLLFDSMDYCNK